LRAGRPWRDPAGVVRSSASVSDTKPTLKMLQFLERGQQIRHRSASTVQPPDQHDVALPAAGGVQ
jgi:hypothetical protein